MATKKSKASAAHKSKASKTAIQPQIRVGCCSAALDIVFVEPQYSVEAGSAPVELHSVRIKHDKKFQILGLSEVAVNKGTTPWQIFVVEGENPSELTGLTLPVPKKPRKK